MHMYKMRLIDSPVCKCGKSIQSLNHVFWTCSLVEIERSKIYIILRNFKLMDPFSMEYVLGNLSKKTAAIIIKFANIVYAKLGIRI